MILSTSGQNRSVDRLSNLLQQFFWVALLQGRPQDIPRGQAAMGVALAINVVTYVLAVTSSRAFPSSLMLAITDLALSGACLYLVVSVVNKGPRFQQAYTALAGGTAVLNLAAAPVLWLSNESASTTIGLMDLIIILWGLAIIAHVLRHTLEVSSWLSVGLALGFYVVVLNLMALTGVINPSAGEGQKQQEMSIYQPVIGNWSSKA